MNQKVNSRLHYIDVLNCIAIMFVLLLHSSQLANFGTVNNSNYLITKTMQCLFIPAVYIFFMNSGATLLDYRDKYSTLKFFEKRIKRVLVPFLLWSVFYYIFNTRFHAFPGPIFQDKPGVKDFLVDFLNNNINNLFWFFYAIIALYIATPIMSVLVKNHKKVLVGIVIGYFIFTDVLSYLGHLLSINLLTNYIDQPLISSSYLGYFVIGYLIKINYFNKKVENVLIGLGILALVLNIMNVLTSSRFIFINNIGPFLYSVGLYLIIKRIVENKKGSYKIAKFLSGVSLGVYILHPIFFAIFDKTIFRTSSSQWTSYLSTLNNPIHIFIMPFIVYVVIAIPLHYLKKIKIINYIIP